ncbi:MAG TPA: DUF2934 domain-containing protein [Terriglobales bacterium]|nr:DUF2934 domain-containing protein [Terriglobales bacterium]
MDSETATRERQRLMVDLLAGRIRLRARQIYEQRGKADGQALEDWIKAESEVLKTSILVPLWNRRQELEM